MTAAGLHRWGLAQLAAIAALLSIAVGLIIGALGSPSMQYQVVENGIPCLFRSWTGLLCPSCGMTHATVSMGQGDIAASLAAHPLAPLVLLIIAWASIQLLRGRPIAVAGHRLSPVITLSGIAIVWVANLTAHAL